MIYKRKHNKYMIRNRILIVYLLFISISILTGCCINQTVNETELTYGDDLINLVEETMKQEPREENEIQITKAEIVASFEDETKQIVLANIYQMGFIPEEGRFISSSGAMFPVEIQYEIDDRKLVNPLVIYPLNGSEFSSSLKKMSRNNIKWYNQLMESQNAYHRIYNDMIQKLKKEIVENNLDGYIHTKDEIPNYTEDIIFLEALKNEPKGNIAVVKEEAYFKAKNEIGKVNWPHYEGILFNEATGIAVEAIFDEFPK